MHDTPTVKAILTLARFDVWNLAGPRNKELRQRLMLALTGIKTPIAKCGVNALETALHKHIDISTASCRARYNECYKQYFA